MRYEGGLVRGVVRGERCHVDGTRVALVVEKMREIFVDDVPQEHCVR